MRTLKNAEGKKGEMLTTAKNNTMTAFSIPSYQRIVDEIEAAAIRKKSKVVLKIRVFCPRLSVSSPHLKRLIYVVITFVPVIWNSCCSFYWWTAFNLWRLNKNLCLSRSRQRVGVPAQAWQYPGSSNESVYKPALKAHKELRMNSYQTGWKRNRFFVLSNRKLHLIIFLLSMFSLLKCLIIFVLLWSRLKYLFIFREKHQRCRSRSRSGSGQGFLTVILRAMGRMSFKRIPSSTSARGKGWSSTSSTGTAVVLTSRPGNGRVRSLTRGSLPSTTRQRKNGRLRLLVARYCHICCVLLLVISNYPYIIRNLYRENEWGSKNSRISGKVAAAFPATAPLAATHRHVIGTALSTPCHLLSDWSFLLCLRRTRCGSITRTVMKLVLSMNTRDYFNSEFQKLFQQWVHAAVPQLVVSVSQLVPFSMDSCVYLTPGLKSSQHAKSDYCVVSAFIFCYE